jgi:HD-GYP domain-containing protein (c-di-GMP phosphodiesterase class II)
MVGTETMNAIVTLRADKPGKRVCGHCGAPVMGTHFVRDGHEYGCEACFLAARKRQALPATADEAPFALAEALVAALDAREHETGLHSKRVACHTLVLAKHFTTEPQRLRQIYHGALLHDIGKIGIPDAILLKQSALTDGDWQVMRTHPDIGHRILAGAPFMDEAAEIVLNHEERFDGSGYPRGLAGTAIPLWARLFAVIDTLDAITSDRPYRKGLSFDAACAEILRVAGTQFDPQAVAIFVAEEATLRGMVELKWGAAPADIPGAGYGRFSAGDYEEERDGH